MSSATPTSSSLPTPSQPTGSPIDSNRPLVATSSSAASNASSTSAAPTGGGDAGGNVGGNSGSTPLSVFTFVIAIALFVIVVAFVLLRIFMRNRRLRRMGFIPDGPFDNFLGRRDPLRELEDTVVPPRLWEAKIVPVSAYSQEIHGGGTHSSGGGEKSATLAQPQLACGWDHLMPISASLPISLWTATGAAKALADTKTSEKADDEDASGSAAATERIPGSVNVSVFISMPSAPKQGEDELPELMIGTAAVPIFTRPKADAAAAAAAASAPQGYFDPQSQQSQQQEQQGTSSSSNNEFTHPTRSELLALYKAARRVKAAKATKRQQEAEAEAAAKEAAGAAGATAGSTSTSTDAAPAAATATESTPAGGARV